jgi:thiol-disulfide isomerase/thioredoxin
MNARTVTVPALAALSAFLAIGPAGRQTVDAQSASAPFACAANAKTAKLNFTLKDLNNAPVKLADFKGKVILLDFWATWCIPCKTEIPWFVDLQNRYGSAGLATIGVSVDDKLETLKPYALQLQMNYPVLQGRGHDDILDTYGPMTTVPTAIVIARDGKICARHAGLTPKDQFENEIKSLL